MSDSKSKNFSFLYRHCKISFNVFYNFNLINYNRREVVCITQHLDILSMRCRRMRRRWRCCRGWWGDRRTSASSRTGWRRARGCATTSTRTAGPARTALRTAARSCRGERKTFSFACWFDRNRAANELLQYWQRFHNHWKLLLAPLSQFHVYLPYLYSFA